MGNAKRRKMLRKVSVIIPTRNEAQFILETLSSVLCQDYPSHLLEVIVADGDSEDETPSLIQGVVANHANVILINNPERVVPYALNYAIKRATGAYIIRMDSHSIYPLNYISTLVKESQKLQADNVGARVITNPANDGVVAIGIAAAISHPLGVGNSSFRLEGSDSKQVDTVPFGCFPRALFDKIGFFDTDLIRNQDDEFNGRIIKNGGKIYLVPNLSITYYTRGTLRKMMKMFYQYGLFKPLVNKKLGSAATIRQFVPPAFVLFFLMVFFLPLLGGYVQILWGTGMFFYLCINLLVSLKISWGKSKLGLAFVLPLIFLCIHFSYGYGYLRGFMLVNFMGRNPGGQNFATSR